MATTKRNRHVAGKIHSRHSVIEGAWEWLDGLAVNPEIKGVIPGRIYHKKSPRQRGPKYVGTTPTGELYKFHDGMAVQEFFVIR